MKVSIEDKRRDERIKIIVRNKKRRNKKGKEERKLRKRGKGS